MTTTVNINSALKINVTPIESGASGGVLFQKSDGKLGQSSNLHWDDTNSRLSLGQGTAPGARLDVRAQGALSTDIAFRVRNGAGTANLFEVNGVGNFISSADSVINGVNIGSGGGSIVSNTRLGLTALSSNTSGSTNTALGGDTLRGNTTGSQNTAVGYFALYSNNGSLNTAVGRNASQSNTTGQSNTSIGANSLLNNTTGVGNIANGANAGRYISGGANLTIANNSVFLGAETRANANNETNQIVIGHNAIGTGSNSVTLGNTSITQTNLRGQIVISGFASAPVGVEGAIYYDTVLKKHYGFNGTNWNALY